MIKDLKSLPRADAVADESEPPRDGNLFVNRNGRRTTAVTIFAEREGRGNANQSNNRRPRALLGHPASVDPTEARRRLKRYARSRPGRALLLHERVLETKTAELRKKLTQCYPVEL